LRLLAAERVVFAGLRFAELDLAGLRFAELVFAEREEPLRDRLLEPAVFVLVCPLREVDLLVAIRDTPSIRGTFA
jgi:hypothetical protein